jgi:Ca2+-binding EF-hand superfamily protein
MHIKGATLTKSQMITKFDQDLLQDMKDEIKTLFKAFDINNDGSVDASEI